MSPHAQIAESPFGPLDVGGFGGRVRVVGKCYLRASLRKRVANLTPQGDRLFQTTGLSAWVRCRQSLELERLGEPGTITALAGRSSRAFCGHGRRQSLAHRELNPPESQQAFDQPQTGFVLHGPSSEIESPFRVIECQDARKARECRNETLSIAGLLGNPQRFLVR